MSSMKEKQNGKAWGAGAVVAALCLGGCLYGLWQSSQPEPAPEIVPPVVSETEPSVSIPEEEPVPMVEAPANFAEMREKYPDIYAWVQVPGTPIDYPIVQRFGDDSYYLRRDLDGNYSVAGTLFTEFQYNVDDFSDPVTVVYGHQMNDGTMFGSLQPHMTSHELGAGDLIYIYLPECRKTYQIFAAVPYDTSHVLYYHDFHTEEGYDGFLEKIRTTRSLYANVNEALLPSFGDPMVILSTCLVGDNTKRFLVLGSQINEEPVRQS